jgi:hypothetical protein
MDALPISIATIHSILSPIPEQGWMSTAFTNGVNKCCAVGHLQRLLSPNPMDYSRSNCTDKAEKSVQRTNIRLQSRRFLKGLGFDLDIADVNNGECRMFKQDSPKKRVMALLDMMCQEEEYLLAKEAERLKEPSQELLTV